MQTLLLLAACGTQIGDEGKPPFVSTGSFTVEASTLAFPPVLDHWDGRLTAEHDLLAAAEGEQVVRYELYVGASASESASDLPEGIGFHLYSDDGSVFAGDTTHALATREDARGEVSQVDARVADVSYVSDGGTVTLELVGEDTIRGRVDAPLVEPGIATQHPTVATFEGELGRSCSLLDFETFEPEDASEGTAEVTHVGTDDPRCAALFE